jgi:hypothetical protein
LDNPDSADSAKLQAIQMLWDRGYGKPAATTVNINQNMDAKPSQLDAESLDKRIADTLNRVEKLTRESSEDGDKRPTDIRKYN